MNFYSAYYKKQANYDQISQLKDKFDNLDLNADGALNVDELANIFSGQTMTEQEKELLMLGVDGDNDNYLTYLEFTPTFVEFDIDQNAEISGDEYDLAKKRFAELGKQMAINEQYNILNSITSTNTEKAQARHNIDVFNAERNIIYGELDVKKKAILISDKELKAQEIQDFIDTNTLLEFDEVRKTKEITTLNAEKDILLLEKAISQNKLNLEAINLALINKNYEKANETNPALIIAIKNALAILEQEKIKYENDFNASERNLELHYNQIKIDDKESLLTKFFIPEFMKDNARIELEFLYDEKQLTAQRLDLSLRVSALSDTRAQILTKIKEYNQSVDAVEKALLQQEINQLKENEATQKLEATLANKQVELLDKKIQLKAVIPKSDQKPFDEVRTTLETEIATLETQIAALESQLGL
ncbi:MAG TPA: hypothetical protein P5556_06815 [Candidatus Gastranaerophilales bacterium]|nr:hypothetical protein [Candidatus Gastranaerophilales bacterium]